MEWDKIEFGGRIMELAEKEFAARAKSDLTDELYAQWQADGSPRGKDAWIRAKLGKLFVAADKRPVWPKRLGIDWQYDANGRPMVFLGQFTVPAHTLPSGHTVCECFVYVFGAPEGPPDNWTMKFKTILLPTSL